MKIKLDPDRLGPRGLGNLIREIEQSHHVFTRSALQDIARLMSEIDTPGVKSPPMLNDLIHDLEADLLPHLLKEERILFPYIIALELKAANHPPAPFGSVANPIRMMEVEHTTVADLLGKLRAATNNYAPSGNQRLDNLYARLSQLDADLVEHIHWENDVLFPKAIDLERANKARR